MSALSERQAYEQRPGPQSRLRALRLAPDGRPRPDAPFGRGPLAARVLRVAIVTASAIGGRLPPTVAHGLARVGGTLEWAARPRKRRTLAVNLGHALGRPPDDPAVRRAVRREVVNEARRSADLLWAIARQDEVRATARIEGVQRTRAVFREGKGVILASPHLGGWEVATSLATPAMGVPSIALVTDDWLAWAIAPLRERGDLGIVYTSEPVRRVADHLRLPGCVVMLGDIVMPGMRTYPVRFLDAVAELPAGIAALARLTEAAIVPMAILPEAPRRWVVDLGEPIPAPPRSSGREGEQTALQKLADAWTAAIRAHAEHWAAVYPITWR
jgi:lauroyl/myristoyl acyltransferase